MTVTLPLRLVTPLLAVAVVLAGCGAPRPATPAARADAAAQALQQGYYQAGRFQGAGYWQNAQGLWVVLDAYQRTQADQWKQAIAQMYRANAQGAPGNFRGKYVDDEGWWAVDWIRAWDLTGNTAYLTSAKGVFSHMAADWGGDCGGGVYWNHSNTYKNAIPNELFLQVATMLHEVTPGDTVYLGWAKKEAAWFLQSGMINSRGLVNDGLTGTCRNNGGTPWTYNQGVILAGLGELYHTTGDRTYLQTAERIAAAATKDLVNGNGVLYEKGCEGTDTCGADGALFKGIFVRSLWWLYRYDPKPAYRAFLERSTGAIWANGRTTVNTFGLHWDGPAPNPVLLTVEDDISATMALTATATDLPTPVRRG